MKFISNKKTPQTSQAKTIRSHLRPNNTVIVNLRIDMQELSFHRLKKLDMVDLKVQG